MVAGTTGTAAGVSAHEAIGGTVSLIDKIRERRKIRRAIDGDDLLALARVAVTIGLALSDSTISEEEIEEIQQALDVLRRARGK